MIKGDIILVPFPFTDLSGSKTRPALVLYTDERDVTVAFISSQAQIAALTDILLKPDELNRLKQVSVIRLSKLATLDRDIVLGKLGELSKEQLGSVNQNLIALFQLG
ncbi:MAG: type II toxin-antitoxin system PemK/MazF family toxin [Chitinophagaceae bacterium]|nr:type II toxin-antitoxin system PemK/MazF family toxin [Chitinophagaceae bacterium]